MVQSFYRIAVPKGIHIFVSLNRCTVVHLFLATNHSIAVHTTSPMLCYFYSGTLQQTYVLRLVSS